MSHIQLSRINSSRISTWTLCKGSRCSAVNNKTCVFHVSPLTYEITLQTQWYVKPFFTNVNLDDTLFTRRLNCTGYSRLSTAYIILTPSNRVLLEKLIVTHLIRKIPTFLEPKCSLPCLQNLPLFPILSQMKPVHTFKTYVFKTHFNIILPSTTRSSKWFPHFDFSGQHVWISCRSHACYVLLPSHRPWFDHPNNIWWRVEIMMLFIM